MWREAVSYVAQSVSYIAAAPWLYAVVAFGYATPAAAAAGLIAFVSQPCLWQLSLIIGLPWLTIVLGTVVVMVVVGYQVRGRPVNPVRATRVALRWVPRYAWTNVHTSVVFWVPVGTLLVLREVIGARLRGVVPTAELVDAATLLVVLGLALYLHTRTLLAPFLAVHGDLPGTLAALEAWRLAGQHFGVCFATLVLGSLPVGLPLGIVTLSVAQSLSDSGRARLFSAGEALAWVGIQLVRPVLIPALYMLYRDVWKIERAQSGLHVPRAARPLLRLTEALPKFGNWD